MHHRPIRNLALAGAALAAAGPAVAEITVAYYNSPSNYAYSVKHMPDFDQRRMQTPSVPGLPNGGSMYCAPASAMNICAYIADHGFPDVPPGDYSWFAPGNYDLATGSLLIMGLLSGTDATNGTGGDGWLAGFEAWVPLDLFTVQAFYAGGSYWPRRWDVAQSAAGGALVAFCYGFYDIDGYQNGLPIIVRTGGHCVTLTGALAGNTPNAFFNVRDPADDPANTTQSAFVNRTVYPEGTWVFGNGALRVVDNLANDPGDPLRRVLDGYIAVRPKAGVTWSEPAQGFVYVPATQLQGSLTLAPLPSPGGPAGAWTFGPTFDGIYTTVDEGFGEQMIRYLPFGGGEAMDLDIWSSGPHGLVTSPQHVLYVANDFAVRSYDLTTYPPDPVATLDLSGPATAIAFDDVHRRVLVYNSESFAIQVFDADLQNEVGFWLVPGDAAEGDTTDIAYDPAQNMVWMVSNRQPVVWHVPLQDGAAAQSYALPGAGEVTSIDVDDQGHLFVADGGVLREYVMNEVGELEAFAGPLAGMTVGEIARVTRCRTNFDPSLHVEGWHNVLPTDADFGHPTADCDADLDDDGAVDFADLLELLGDWGPCPANAECDADVDSDEVVGFNDLLLLLANYGPCP